MQLPRIRRTFTLILIAIFMLLATLGASALVASASAKDALVRIIQGSPDSGSVDVFIDGKKFVSDLAFAGLFGYTKIPAGQHEFKVAPAHQGVVKAMISQNFIIESGTLYTMAIVGIKAAMNTPVAGTSTAINTPNAISAQVVGTQVVVNTPKDALALVSFQDESKLVNSTMARIRVYHLSPNTGSLTITHNNRPVINELSYENASNYEEAPASVYTFDVTATNVKLSASATLKPGTVNSIFLVGLYKSEPALKFVTASVPGTKS